MICNEIWKDVPGFEGFYKVSNLGRVLGVKSDKVKNAKIDRYGYPSISLYNAKRKTRLAFWFTVHRLVAAAFISNPGNLPQVNHKDGNKMNNSMDNLEWCSNSWNIKHAFSLGLKDTKGQKNGQSKLTESQVLSIRMDKRKQYDLAREYGVSQSMISNIQLKKAWAWLR